jgi:predicted nucleic acid-binding protein
MKSLVVDASIAIKWVVGEPDSPAALALADRFRLVAPELMIAEFANVLRSKIRSKEFEITLLAEAIDVLWASRVSLKPMSAHVETAVTMAARIEHPAYDCFYLSLALSEGCRLVTADDRFLRSVRNLGLPNEVDACVSLRELSPS